MTPTTEYDAVIVGSGPNGLTAAVELARSGWSVLVIEGSEQVGGGLRSSELVSPGSIHDQCAAVHPLGRVSPAWQQWPLHEFGLDWVTPDVSFAHVFSADAALAIDRSWQRTLDNLGIDGSRWDRLFGYLTRHSSTMTADVLQPLRMSHRPVGMTAFGARALWSTDMLTRIFSDERSRTLFAAVAAHAIRPTDSPASAAAGLLLTSVASSTGWPIARGGSQAIADALAGYLTSLGGRIETGWHITRFEEIPPSRVVLFDTAPHAMTKIMGHRVPTRYQRRIDKYRYGPGVCKVDYLLTEPIPFSHPDLARTATFHLAQSYDHIKGVEADVAAGRHPARPWLLGGEPTRIDPSRSSDGHHIAWAYCHVPSGSTVDMTDAMTAEIELCAPGFRDVIVGSSTKTAAEFASYNPNLVGGDIGCGASNLGQLLARPVASINPYATPMEGIYLCSSATPPGGGAHGMSGYNAARQVLR